MAKKKKNSKKKPEKRPAAGNWSETAVSAPQVKRMISLRVDPDVLEFFKADGRGYQTRMNAVLRAYMAAHRSR